MANPIDRVFPKTAEAAETDAVDVSPVGLGLALAGAGAMVVGLFLPLADSARFGKVVENSLIQHGKGWQVLFVATATVAAAFAVYRRGRGAWAVVLFGIVAVGLAIAWGTDDELLTLSSAVRPDRSLPVREYLSQLADTERASPGIGIYVVGVGGALAVAGGVTMSRGWGGGGPMKACPDCAEKVQAEARVCKHCGYRFDSASTT